LAELPFHRALRDAAPDAKTLYLPVDGCVLIREASTLALILLIIFA
jgi:hypothetical protein